MNISRIFHALLFRLEHQPLIVSTSTLSNKEDKAGLINSLLILGGHLQKDWSPECSYLVMPAITYTVKVSFLTLKFVEAILRVDENLGVTIKNFAAFIIYCKVVDRTPDSLYLLLCYYSRWHVPWRVAVTLSFPNSSPS